MTTPASASRVAVRIALGVVVLLAGLDGRARAQNTAPDRAAQASQASSPDTSSATLDVTDLWRRIRHKPPLDAAAQSGERKVEKVWAPIIGGKPSVGALIGVAGNLAFFRGDSQTTRISTVNTSLTYSTTKQTSVSARLSVFSPGDRYRLEGDNRAKWGSQDTYGLGTATQENAAVQTKFDFFRVHEIGYRRVTERVFAGVGLHFDDYSDFRPGSGVEEDEWNETGFVTYSNAHGLPLDHQVSAGLSATLLADTRDSTIDPRTGSYGTASYRGLIKGFLGGSSGWQLLHFEGRRYAPLGHDGRQRLALWLFSDFTFGGPIPYFDLPATGMDQYGRSGRGYAEGRFRGERLLYGEAEYRRTITQNGLLGMVVFLNTTTVTNLDQGEQLFEHLAPGGGAGLRVLLNKRSRVQLCFDVGFGERGSKGVYVGIQEAF
jgi:hypothetical protein